jgi:hypothetical protein
MTETMLPDDEQFRRLVMARIADVASTCLHGGLGNLLGESEATIIVAGELVKPGAIFAAKAGVDKEDITKLAIDCFTRAETKFRAGLGKPS